MLLHQMFIDVAKKFSGKTAIIDRTTEKELTYKKLLIASLILGKKIKKYDDDLIGVMLPTSAGSILSMLGCLVSGKTPVMINYSTGAEKNVEYAQKKCSFHTVITSKKLLENIGCPEMKGMVFVEDILDSVSATDKISAALSSKLPASVLKKRVYDGQESDVAVILFTSGSEKDPKAVELTHKNLLSNTIASGEWLGALESDVMLAILPLFHVFGQMTNVWLPLYYGMTIVSYANPLEYKTVAGLIRDFKPTVMTATPAFYMGYSRQSREGDLSSLRLAVVGADKAPDFLREEYLEKHDVTLLEGYGTTETSPVVSVNTLEYNRPGSIGKLIPGVQVEIRSVETGEPMEAGEEGKIFVKGDLVMKGYFDDLEETSLRVLNGWYDTGDMGLMDEDGYLWHKGRLKRFVKIGGEMVSLVNIEYELEKILPHTIECCVVELPDTRKGAQIIVAVSEEVDRKEIQTSLKDVLPAIALPKQFIVIGELPKMPSGKIDFRTTKNMVMENLENAEKA